MCFSARQVVGGVKWIVYQNSNAWTGHGAINTEGVNKEQWDAAAEKRPKASTDEAQKVCNLDMAVQGFTYDNERMIYWKLTEIDPSRFRKKAGGLAVYVKEDAVKANAAKRRNEHVRKQMAQTFDRYTGSEKWITHEFVNAYTGQGATNLEGRTAEEWDAAAKARPPATLSDAKAECDQDPECHGFTYDPDNLMFWPLKDIDPRKFRRAYGHEYHVYMKEHAHVLHTLKIKAEYAESSANAVKALQTQRKEQAAAQRTAEAEMGKGGTGTMEAWKLEEIYGIQPQTLLERFGAEPWLAPSAPSFEDAITAAPVAPDKDIALEPSALAGATPAKAPPPAAPPGKGAGKPDGGIPKGSGKSTPAPVSEAIPSKFERDGTLASAPTIKGKDGSKGDKPALKRKPKVVAPPLTSSTITLRGPGFQMGREDIVLDACQELAFIEGFNWPDYAVIVQDNLCHVEWPTQETAATFCDASQGTLQIEAFGNRSFIVKRPVKHQETVTADATGFSEGTRVQIQNLTGAKELNGKFAKVQSFNEATGRYIVSLEENANTQKSLKPDNLRSLGPELAAAKAKAAPAKPSSSRVLAEGARVYIENLTGKDLWEIGAVDMNGQIALVKEFNKETGRYSIELEEQKGVVYTKLKPENLSPLDTGLTELELRKKRALGSKSGVEDALKGVNGDMWANFLNMFGNEPDTKRQKG